MSKMAIQILVVWVILVGGVAYGQEKPEELRWGPEKGVVLSIEKDGEAVEKGLKSAKGEKVVVAGGKRAGLKSSALGERGGRVIKERSVRGKRVGVVGVAGARERLVRSWERSQREGAYRGDFASLEVVRRVILRRMGHMNRCVSRHVRRWDKRQGKVVVDLYVNLAGNVTKTVWVETTTKEGVLKCFDMVLRRTKFPKPRGEGAVLRRSFVLVQATDS